jgi:hypothetical protein
VKLTACGFTLTTVKNAGGYSENSSLPCSSFIDLFPTHSPILDVSFSTVKVAEYTEGACAGHRLVTLSIRPTRNGVIQTTGDPLAITLLDALQHPPHPTRDMRQGAHPQLTVNVLPPSLLLNEGGRHPVGAVYITLTANLTTNREVPGGVTVPLAAAALSAQPVTIALFLTLPPHTTAVIHTPNRTSLLLRTLLNLQYQKWATGQFAVPSALSKAQFWPPQRPHQWPLRPQCPRILPKCPRGHSQIFSRRLPH